MNNTIVLQGSSNSNEKEYGIITPNWQIGDVITAEKLNNMVMFPKVRMKMDDKTGNIILNLTDDEMAAINERFVQLEIVSDLMRTSMISSCLVYPYEGGVHVIFSTSPMWSGQSNLDKLSYAVYRGYRETGQSDFSWQITTYTINGYQNGGTQ